MIRQYYLSYIGERLSTLSTNVRLLGSLNLLELNIYAEDFFVNYLNQLFGWKLINLNAVKQNSDVVDLYDSGQNLFVQVSATSTKQKIEKSLNSDFFKSRKGCHFMFLCITDDAKNLRKLKYTNPHGVLFTPSSDIIDLSYLLRQTQHLDIIKQKELYELTRGELGEVTDNAKFNSNLSAIVDILSRVNLSDVEHIQDRICFNIDDKIKYNDLQSTRKIIEDNQIFCTTLNAKYKEFDMIGANRSLAVLHSIRKHYIEAVTKCKYDNPDKLFLGILQELMDEINDSDNCPDLPIEELELCLCIIVVDAFLRCKIFENPEGIVRVTA